MEISPDSQALLLLGSRLGLPKDSALKPLTLREWNPLARKLHAHSLRPADLLGQSASEINAMVKLPDERSQRLETLLARGGVLAIELERLKSLGIWAWTRADKEYPSKYRQRLKDSAPMILFGAGDKYLPGQPGLAMVGSRNVDENGEEAAETIGNICGHAGLVVYSGGARGVDKLSMKAALGGRGNSVGILAHSLEKAIRAPEYRKALANGDLTLLTPYTPNAGFSAGAAMGRNKLIYTLADYALVIASDYQKGGTWTGASEALKKKWLPVFVLDNNQAPEGNRKLLEKGAFSFPYPLPQEQSEIRSWLENRVVDFVQPEEQLQLL